MRKLWVVGLIFLGCGATAKPAENVADATFKITGGQINSDQIICLTMSPRPKAQAVVYYLPLCFTSIGACMRDQTTIDASADFITAISCGEYIDAVREFDSWATSTHDAPPSR